LTLAPVRNATFSSSSAICAASSAPHRGIERASKIFAEGFVEARPAIEERHVESLPGLRVVLKLKQQMTAPRRKERTRSLPRVRDLVFCPHCCFLPQSLAPGLATLVLGPFVFHLPIELHLAIDQRLSLGRAFQLLLLPRIAARPIIEAHDKLRESVRSPPDAAPASPGACIR
jgi:hypothetical protein